MTPKSRKYARDGIMRKLLSFLFVVACCINAQAVNIIYKILDGQQNPITNHQCYIQPMSIPAAQNGFTSVAIGGKLSMITDSSGQFISTNPIVNCIWQCQVVSPPTQNPFTILLPQSLSGDSGTYYAAAYLTNNPTTSTFPFLVANAYPTNGLVPISTNTGAGYFWGPATGGAGGGSQTPWTNNQAAANFSLSGLLNLALAGSITQSGANFLLDSSGNMTALSLVSPMGYYSINNVGVASFNGDVTSMGQYHGDGSLLTGIPSPPITNIVAGAGLAGSTNSGTKTVTLTTNGSSLQIANNLSDVANASTSAHNLGLGTADSPTFTGLTTTSTAQLNGLNVGSTGTTGPAEMVLYVNGGANNANTGDSGFIIQNGSTNYLQSGNSLFISTMSTNGSGNPIVVDKVAASFAVVPARPQRPEGLNPGNSILVFNQDPVNMKGLYICSPGAGYDLGNYPFFVTSFVSGQRVTGIPFWQPGVYQVDGVSYNFTVSGVSVTPLNSTQYTNSAGTLFTVGMNTISAGSGIVNMSATNTTSTLPSSGTLTKVAGSGTGDNTLAYSSFTTNGWIWSLFVNPATGLTTINKSAAINGTVTVGGSQWTSSVVTNRINGASLDHNIGIEVTNVLSDAPVNTAAYSWGGNALSMGVTGGGDMFWSDSGGELFRVGHNDSYFRINSGLALGFSSDAGNNIGSTDGVAVGRPSNAYIKNSVFAGASLVVGAITNTSTFTTVYTNFNDAFTYTNLTGRSITVLQPCVCTPALSLGNASYAIKVNGVIKLTANQPSILAGIIPPATNFVTYDIPAGATFSFNDVSTAGTAVKFAGGYYRVN